MEKLEDFRVRNQSNAALCKQLQIKLIDVKSKLADKKAMTNVLRFVRVCACVCVAHPVYRLVKNEKERERKREKEREIT